MADNFGLTLTVPALDSIDATLRDMLGIAVDIAFKPPPARAQPRAGGYPWAPGTVAQGFLSSRWNRRDGNVYTASPALDAPYSPYEGGDDSQSQIDYRARHQQRNAARPAD